MTISICFCANDKYIRHTSVAIISILKNATTSEDFHFYVLHSNVSKENQKRFLSLRTPKCQIDFIHIDNNDFKDFYMNNSIHLTIETYFRFKIISLFPQLDRILYLDGDLLVLKDLSELYYTDFGENWFGMVPDANYKNGRYNVKPYCNAGVLLFNLKKCREDDVLNLLVNFDHSKYTLDFMDQDILNLVGQGHIYVLPKQYNQQIHPEVKENYLKIKNYIKNTVILHYTTGMKPWGDYYPNSLQNYYFKYLKKSPWHEYYLKIKLRRLKIKLHPFWAFPFRYEQNAKNDKFKFLGITLFKKDRKKEGIQKYLIFSIPVWKNKIKK